MRYNVVFVLVVSLFVQWTHSDPTRHSRDTALQIKKNYYLLSDIISLLVKNGIVKDGFRKDTNDVKETLGGFRQLIDQMNSTLQTVQQNQQKQNKKLKALDRKQTEVENIVKNISTGVRIHTAFCASYQAKKYSGQKLIFTKVLLNEGNAYSSNTGVFTCKKDGFYVVSWNIELHRGKESHGQLMVNGNQYVRAYVGDKNYNSDGTGTVILKLQTNDKVYVNTGKPSDIDPDEPYFCGWNL